MSTPIADALATLEVLGWRFVKRADGYLDIYACSDGIAIGPEHLEVLTAVIALVPIGRNVERRGYSGVEQTA